MSNSDQYEQSAVINEPVNWSKMLADANMGNEEAMVVVADAYFYGDGVEENHEQAFKWYQKASKLHSDNGYVWKKLGDCYYVGYGVEMDRVKSADFYEKAWDNGNKTVTSVLGIIYKIYKGDYANSFKWFERGAELGNPNDLYFTGFYCLEGLGTPKNEKRAIESLERAAALNNVNAIRCLLMHNYFGDESKYEKTMQKLIKMAADGDNEAQFTLGNYYQYGFDIDETGKRWNINFAHNPQFAEHWYKLAAEQGNSRALLELGEKYIDKDSGFTYDLEKGEQYLIEAANSGMSSAASALHSLYKYELYDEQKALYWAEYLVVRQNMESLAFDVAEAYYNGEGTNKNLSKTAEFYNIAAIYYTDRLYGKPNDDFSDTRMNADYFPCAKSSLLCSLDEPEKYNIAFYCLQCALKAASVNREVLLDMKVPEMHYWLAYMFDNGLGTEQNVRAAYEEYNISAQMGYEKAGDELRHFKKTMFGVKRV